MSAACPTCGRRVSSFHDAVLRSLMQGAKTSTQIAEEIWRDDPDGGPLSAASNVRAAIHRLKRRGYAIERAGDGYRLMEQRI